MKTRHIHISVIAVGVILAGIVLVTHGFALLLLLPLVLIVGPLVLLFMATGDRANRSGQ